MLSTGATKISLSYDEIKVLDRDLGLYLVKNNNKYGVVNDKEQYVIHLEYDAIGIDASTYPSNPITNQYLLFDNIIPVKQGNKWGLFNKKGEKVIEIEYDSIGCIASTVKDKIVNNLLVIPDIEAIVICKDKKYGLITSSGQELLPCALNVMYSVTNAGIDDYYMVYPYMDAENKQQEITYNIFEYLEAMNIINFTQNNENNTEDNNMNNQNTTTNQQNSVENNVQTNIVQSQVNDIVL